MMVLMTQEEYSPRDDEEEEESTSGVATIALASFSPPLLFVFPNENLPNNSSRPYPSKCPSHAKQVSELKLMYQNHEVLQGSMESPHRGGSYMGA